jgi:excinuclease UvrABC nuclease subunit
MKMKPGKWFRYEMNDAVDSRLPSGVNFPGTYAIFADKKCLYIGQSQNIEQRLKSHITMARYSNTWWTKWGQFHKVNIAIRRERFRLERVLIEARLIFRLNPIGNILLKNQGFQRERLES